MGSGWRALRHVLRVYIRDARIGFAAFRCGDPRCMTLRYIRSDLKEDGH